MEVSSLNLPGLALDFPWEPQIHDVNGGGVHQGDLTTGTATTSTAVMPVLLTHNQPAAVDTTLPLDPSFVDIEHPGLGRKTPVPSKRKASVAGSGTTRTTTTSSSTSASKVRSVSTPTPSTNVHSAPRSSSKSRGHRSTKSHGNFHQEDHIQEDLLLNLLKEFRAAKKKEREGGSTDAGTGSVSLSLGVKSLLSHAARRPQPPHEPNAAQDHSSPPSYDSTTRPGSPDGARPAPQKTRQRSASTSTSTPSKPRTQSKSNSGSSAEVILLLGTLKQETRRANAAEAQLNELLDRYKVMRQERLNAESQLAVIREELKLYKEQLDAAQKEIYRAQQIVDSVDRQRVLAEQDAQRNRERCRKLFEERLVAQAQEEGRREGYEEGMRRGRLAREEQERQIELEREQERAKRRRERDRERQRREEERQEREREEEERRQQERERLEMERRDRVRLELERLKRDREERERREREKLEAARRERERLEAEQLERRRQEVELRRQEEEMRRKEYEEWDRKAKHQPTQRARSNTLAGATAHSTAPSTHRSRARSGSVPGLSRLTNVLSPPPRPPTPPPPLPAKPASPEHRAARSRTPGPYRSYTPNVPIASSSTTPAGDPPPPHGRRSSPPNPSTSIMSMPYVPLPPPPANYIPVMNKDGSVPIPPPFGFKSPPRNNDGATARPPPRPSSRAGDSVRGYANPDRERMRQRIIGVGSPETPTPRPGSTLPGPRPFSRQGDHKGKGKMRVVNEEDGERAQERPKATESPSNGFPWFAPASEVVYPTVESPSPPASNPHRQAPTAMFTSTPPKKPISPPPPGSGPHNANQSARSSGEESRWLLPPDFSYVGGHPAMTPMLVRTATNGTTPTIGVEPPSHSPTTEGEASTAMDSGLLTADGTVAHHDRESEEHEHHSPPETTTPQSYTYQPGPMTTPTDPIPPWNYTSPPQGQPPQYQRYDTNGSASWVSNWNPNPISPPQWGAMGGSSPGSRTGSVQEKSGWVPPPIVPLSPIPGTVSMDYKFNAFAPMSSTGSPGSRVVSPGNEKEPLTFGMAGMTTMGTGKFLSPAPLNRPISLFSDSDGG